MYADQVQDPYGIAVLRLRLWRLLVRPSYVHRRESYQRRVDGYPRSLQPLDVVRKVEKGKDRIQHRMKKMGAKTCNSMEDTFLRRHEIRLSMSSHHSDRTSSLLMVVNTAIVVSWGGEKKRKREEGIRMQSQS